MSIKRYTADADNTITNAFRADLSSTNRATGSNMGEADILEVFSVYGQSSGALGYSSEESRVLVKFPVDSISTDRTAGAIPRSGSVSFYLKMFNTRHSQTLPRNYTLVASPVSQSWEEGYGLDMEEYSDKTYDGFGSNWLMSASGSKWGDSATATITVDDGDGNMTCAKAEKFTITDTAGRSVEYIISDTGTSGATSGTALTNGAGNIGGGTTATVTSGKSGCAVGVNIQNPDPQYQILVQLKTAIESSAGHGGSIVVTALPDVAANGNQSITLTQSAGGSSGNNTITEDVANTGVSGFTAGTDNIGGSYHASPKFKQTLDRGTEDLEVDITHLVENWIDGEADGEGGAGGGSDYRKLNYGVGVALTSSQTPYAASSISNTTIQNLTGAVRSYYTKKFFARGSEFWFKRPCLEARWDSSIKDNAGNFRFWSPMAENADNINTIYFYNIVNGQLKNIPSGYLTENKILVSLYSGSHDNTRPRGERLTMMSSAYSAIGAWTPIAATNDLNATGGLTTTTGIYSCSLAITGADSGSLTNMFAVWHNKSMGNTRYEFHTSSMFSSTPRVSNTNTQSRHITTATNLRPSYHKDEVAKFRFYIREKGWSPNTYTKATTKAASSIVEDAYYKIVRVSDNYTVVDYGTGSTNNYYSRLSYDVSGNYFDFDLSMLEPDYAYGVKLIYHYNGGYVEQPEMFKFRVEDS